MTEQNADGEILDHAPAEDETVDAAPLSVGPDVDELEDRLRALQGAMDQIQSGDLDAAEQAIEDLEQRMGSTRD